MKYHIARGDEKLGEYNDLDISTGMREWQFQPTELCWAPGMADWETLARRFEQAPVMEEPDTDPFSTLDADASARPRPGDVELASRWQRLLATAVDGLTTVPAAMMLSRALNLDTFFTENSQLPPDVFMDTYYRHISDTVSAHPERFQLPLGMLLGLVVINMVLLTVRGQSVGKWLTGLRIVKFQSGANPGFVSAFLLRHLVMFILFNVSYVGLGILAFDIACIFRQDRRCLHDIIADTVVVRLRRERVAVLN